MSARTACSASKLLWISLMMAFTPGSPGNQRRGKARPPSPPVGRGGNGRQGTSVLSSLLVGRKGCQGAVCIVRHPQLVISEPDGRLAEGLRGLAGQRRWAL